MNAVCYIHGMGGSALEAEHYVPLFPSRTVIGFDYRSQNPWEAEKEFSDYARALSKRFDRVLLIAVSIGAYYAMQARLDHCVESALFISPVVDMEKMISKMMTRAGVTEEQLKAQGVVSTPSGELSWAYLCYARSRPERWSAPANILWGGKDHLVGRESITAFAEKHGARLTVMEEGEHWFHTEEQMRFLDGWIRKSISE